MPGLLRAVARTTVIAGTATAVSNGVSRRQQGRWAAQQEQTQAPQEQQQYAQPPPPPPPVAPDMDATIAALKQLADLNAQGILTDAEFEAQKRKLLGT